MRITIIGAGYAGATLATTLATSFDTDLDICLVGVGANFGRGVAYGGTHGEHLLNTRARDLGATAADTDEFARWLNLSHRAKDMFLPRVAYGEYLHARLQETEHTSTNLTLLEHEVVEVERATGGGFRIYLDDGSDFHSDRVVLAIGALPPQRLPGVGPRLARHWRYIASPWQEGDLERIARDARLLVVGTGLTMVDVLSTLRLRGHRGEVVALSRHGLLPQAHTQTPADPIELPPSVLHALRAHDLHGLIAAVRALTRVVRDWRTVVDALRPHLQGFWGGLSQTQRARFLRHVRAQWEAHRHRMPPRAAEDLEAALGSGRLRVLGGRLVRAGIDGDAIHALIRPRGSASVEPHRFDGLIRATGLDTDIEATTHPLIQHLHASGTIVADPLGLGIRTSSAFEVLDAERRPVPGLYCLGALARGHCWELTAIPELRSAIDGLAARLRVRDVVTTAPIPHRVAHAGNG